ncbi:hypothetical protein ACFVT1_27100 [Streptomyces sp. NPDC057963]|uniref:hypothetical protein n=1 Tax=Streptomyces sp. NPDC057963 TaxID=3346290 RepID=UPI0036EA59E0
MAATAIPAHASDQWHQIPNRTGLPYHQSTGYMYDSGNQVEGWGRVDWSGTKVEVHAGAKLLAGSQGECAVTVIDYDVQINGTWKNDSRSPAIDCSPNESQVISPYYSSNYPVKNVTFRTCIGDATGWVNTRLCSAWSW